ncbi:MAG: hypothetical protein GPW16_04450 [Euryarchaeota archaeon]|nr:hypothetical protein [Euryarchaeota archaeon]
MNNKEIGGKGKMTSKKKKEFFKEEKEIMEELKEFKNEDLDIDLENEENEEDH